MLQTNEEDIEELDQELTLLELVEQGARMRKQPPVARKYIEEACLSILRGDEEATVERYSTGAPTLRSIYDIATRLERAAQLRLH